MKLPSFQQAVGFSVGDALSLFLLRTILEQDNYSRALYEHFNLVFPGRSVSYEYVARTANTLENDGFLLSRTEGRKKVFQITEKGKARLQEYETIYALRFNEVSAVIDRFYYFLTKNGPLPQGEIEPLHEDFRSFISKLLSVKDVVRFIALRLSLNRQSFYMAEVQEQLNSLFGWSPSNGYLYNIAHEMEESNLLVGFWPDERRTVRKLYKTDVSEQFYIIVSASLTERITQVRRYLHYVLKMV
ncbi:helix-turn-helix transcriptional regulator [Sporosarcina sp. E16_3]|uniref:helix-turn-helix transcriptional regulator n=1 Tax=Sporosarcina sp. E16_3 TaxID=2789293 RepID=UPI001A933FAB|nr:helix-turn-helix transcriptional regulator [Sporosarcina sp. E16_3]MBO0600154.1 helix-turn-helix transcriptional regulator [Sporosarcina sp. E16_3]